MLRNDNDATQMSRIFKLPVDILLKIFFIRMRQSLLWSDKKSWLGVTQVCKRWRRIALTHSALWTSPIFSYNEDPRFIKTSLDRSGSASLDIEISLDDPYSQCEDNVHLVLQYLARIEDLYIVVNCSTEEWRNMMKCFLRSPLPRLRKLFIEPDYESCEHLLMLSKGLMTKSVPALREFKIKQCSLPNEITILRGLTILHVTFLTQHVGYQHIPTVAQLLNILEACPNLADLNLCGLSVPDEAKDALKHIPKERIDVPALKKISLTDIDPFYCDAVLTRLKILTELELNICCAPVKDHRGDLVPLQSILKNVGLRRSCDTLKIEWNYRKHDRYFQDITIHTCLRSEDPDTLEKNISFSLAIFWEEHEETDPPMDDKINSLAALLDNKLWSSVTKVEVDYADNIAPEYWCRILKALPETRSLKLTSTPVLGDYLETGIHLLNALSTPYDSKFRKVYLCPLLEELSISNKKSNYIFIEHLIRCLKIRDQQGMRLNKLKIIGNIPSWETEVGKVVEDFSCESVDPITSLKGILGGFA